MEKPFEVNFFARWGDMDFNAHMKNTAYLDFSADVRMLYFSQNGFSMREFERLRLGPVILQDTLEYYRELRMLEKFKVNLKVAGMSEDASRFRMCNEFFKEEGKIAARVTSLGGWFDLAARKMTTPPSQLADVLRSIPKTENFQTLESSLRG
jgi:acyl-CoA thioester hydrolase